MKKRIVGLEWLMVPATRSGIVVDVEARVIPGTTVQRLECQNNNSRQGISSGWRILLQTLKLETFNDPPNDHFARLQGLVAFPKIRFRSGYHHYEFMKKIFPKPAFREPEGIPRGSNKIEALKTGKLPSRRTEIRSFRRIKRSLSILKEKCMANAPVVDLLLRRRPLEFQVGDRVLLRVSPWKGVVRFGKRGKLAPRFVGPFEIVERIGPVAYRLRLPQELSCIHDVFHVSNLKKKFAESDVQNHFRWDLLTRGAEFTLNGKTQFKSQLTHLFMPINRSSPVEL
ncbi:hypothetical protein Tco_1067800 [Tanacetum coccineum]|uniref:Tf2-1-like SH3-like domain-containing protein n=1 Tax=Tanacetum coccineum TaxID=301880 RepID=A0ABQ5HE30_9ASTR